MSNPKFSIDVKGLPKQAIQVSVFCLLAVAIAGTAVASVTNQEEIKSESYQNPVLFAYAQEMPQPPPQIESPQEQPPVAGAEPPGAGGCLIATAAYGSELAPEVQMLREVRDTKVLQTDAGKEMIQVFNEHYYSFSPTVAEWERQNPVFREAVKAYITPAIKTLSILNLVEVESDAQLIGYVTGLAALNIGMYVAAPAVGISKGIKILRGKTAPKNSGN